MSVSQIIIILVVSVIGGYPAVLIADYLDLRAERRFARSLNQKTCSSCGTIFGSSAAQSLAHRAYHWHPMRGKRLDPERHPGRTWIVTCPHCGSESEFTRRGVLFVPPDDVISNK